MAYRIEVAILQFCPLEKKAPNGPFLRSTNSSLKPEWIKIRQKLRRERGKSDNKKAAYLKAAFQMVGAAGFPRCQFPDGNCLRAGPRGFCLARRETIICAQTKTSLRASHPGAGKAVCLLSPC